MGGTPGTILGRVTKVTGLQNAYDSIVKGEGPEIPAVEAPADTPTPENSLDALAKAEARQRKAKGSGATTLASKASIYGNPSGSFNTSRMLLGS